MVNRRTVLKGVIAGLFAAIVFTNQAIAGPQNVAELLEKNGTDVIEVVLPIPYEQSKVVIGEWITRCYSGLTVGQAVQRVLSLGVKSGGSILFETDTSITIENWFLLPPKAVMSAMQIEAVGDTTVVRGIGPTGPAARMLARKGVDAVNLGSAAGCY